MLVLECPERALEGSGESGALGPHDGEEQLRAERGQAPRRVPIFLVSRPGVRARRRSYVLGVFSCMLEARKRVLQNVCFTYEIGFGFYKTVGMHFFCIPSV